MNATNWKTDLMNKIICCTTPEDALRILRTECEPMLEKEIQAYAEHRAFMKMTAGQPFDGAAPFLRHYPYLNIG
ncbi:hypothetical protein [Nocardioides sp.]|uniref:hypothetical protein n=1 Tax=Nocardioides sp. TaxID=35761 RepID=UPI002735D3F9|nr:hypothetical protein [Nocardioides sp.]MDP3891555.1 hypothetical protein [Nocardioides sp.]